ncbi:MAG: hypothetical protein GON13_02620 [Nanoarchaeota archaeon]|nr:hypothetical protein [Nanoarchaeota archaeon]
MGLRKPTNINELAYHTQRPLSRKDEDDQSGFCHMWVFKPNCPSCGDGVLNKPKRKAKFFVCDKCGKDFPVDEMILISMGEYDCPYCEHHGEFEEEWVRTKTAKKFKFKCGGCGKALDVGKLSRK